MPLVDVGDRAPEFELKDQRGTLRRLADFRSRQLLLYFYPADGTEVCTKQACAFRDEMPRLRKLMTVVGVSPDDEESHKEFVREHALGFTLLADTGRKPDGAPAVCSAYGVWQEKTLYGRTFMGVVRTTYLIDANGVVRHRWDRVRVPRHVEKVLEAATGLPPAKGRAVGRTR